MKNSIRFTLAGMFATGLLHISASAQAPAQLPTEGQTGSKPPANFGAPTASKSSTGSMPAGQTTGATSRAAVRNARPSEAEGATTPEPKRNTSSMQPNAGRPAEVNRATATKQPKGSTPTVKQPGGGGVPEYPKPNATAPKSSTGKQPTGTTVPTVTGGTTGTKQPAGSTPTVKQPGGGGVPEYPQPKAEAPRSTTSKPANTSGTPEITSRPTSGAAIPTEYGAQQPPQPKLR